MSKEVVLIAGGTGLVGRKLKQLLTENGYEVRVLTRKATDVANGLFNWNLTQLSIDPEATKNVDYVINLAGTAVAGPKWTVQRKQDIVNSRVESANCLYQNLKDSGVKQYISASGINAYDFSQDNNNTLITEEAPYGGHFLAEVVKKWESAAEQFNSICPVLKLRIGVVFASDDGALQVMAKPIKLFAGARIGTGKQMVPWIDLDDLCRIFLHGIQAQLSGNYNTITGNVSSAELNQKIAAQLKRPMWPIKVPDFALNLVLGEQKSLVLDGLSASNQKLLDSGFHFEHNLESSLNKNLS